VKTRKPGCRWQDALQHIGLGHPGSMTFISSERAYAIFY